MRPHPRQAALAAALAIAIAAAGCGGGSSKPAYCADRDAVQASLNELKNVNLKTESLSTLRTKVTKLENNATALVESARGEFAPQAEALKSAVAQLDAAVRQAAAAPTQQTIATAVTSASGVASSFSALSKEVSSKC